MSNRLVATRISQEAHSRLLKRCADLRCSPYEYLKILVETDMTEEEKEIEPDGERKEGIIVPR